MMEIDSNRRAYYQKIARLTEHLKKTDFPQALMFAAQKEAEGRAKYGRVEYTISAFQKVYPKLYEEILALEVQENLFCAISEKKESHEYVPFILDPLAFLVLAFMAGTRNVFSWVKNQQKEVILDPLKEAGYTKLANYLRRNEINSQLKDWLPFVFE